MVTQLAPVKQHRSVSALDIYLQAVRDGRFTFLSRFTFPTSVQPQALVLDGHYAPGIAFDDALVEKALSAPAALAHARGRPVDLGRHQRVPTNSRCPAVRCGRRG